MEGKMKSKAWACFTSAIIGVPLFCISLIIIRYPELKILDVGLSLLSVSLYIYIYISFKRLLNSNFNYSQINNLISLLIIVEIFTFLIGLIDESANSKAFLLIILVICAILMGISYIMLGLRLLKLGYQFDGLLKKYCYVCIFEGVCAASIILLPFMILLTIVENTFLGLLFMHEIKNNPVSNTSNDLGI
jgi:hypothetical protein